MYKVAVIGGGAAGMTAAISARQNGAQSVVLFEGSDRVGKKILVTGNGRCNLSNKYASVSDYEGKREIVKAVLNEFSVDDTLEFFEKLGLITTQERDGRIYPYSMQAASVLDVLRNALDRYNINVRLNEKVSDIGYDDGYFTVNGVKTEKIIVATGGMASPVIKNYDSYILAKNTGHKITKLYPSLVQLRVNPKDVKFAQGQRVHARVTLIKDGVAIKSEEGELQFTAQGLSGVCIFQLSRYVKEGNYAVEVDLFPQFSETELNTLLKRRNYELVGMLSNKMIQQVRGKEMSLKHLMFDVLGSLPFDCAQVTSGGVCEVSEDLQSKKVKGMYFAGEVVDVDGDCGGFNLQWAWSSGYIAGRNSVK